MISFPRSYSAFIYLPSIFAFTFKKHYTRPQTFAAGLVHVYNRILDQPRDQLISRFQVSESILSNKYHPSSIICEYCTQGV